MIIEGLVWKGKTQAGPSAAISRRMSCSNQHEKGSRSLAGGLGGRGGCRVRFSLPWQMILTVSCSSAKPQVIRLGVLLVGAVSTQERLGLETVPQREWFQQGRFCQGCGGLGLSGFGVFHSHFPLMPREFLGPGKDAGRAGISSADAQRCELEEGRMETSLCF